MALAVMYLAIRPVSPASATGDLAPLHAGKISISDGIAITGARVSDHAAVESGRRVIDAFEFTGTAASPPTSGRASLVVTSGDGSTRTYRARVPGGPGAVKIRIPAGLTVTREMEGTFQARLTISVTDHVLFDGAFSFGYPRYGTTRRLRRVSTSALRDGFDAPVIDSNLWRVWLGDPGKARVEQHDGRLWITAGGQVGYNGLAARVRLPTRDVVAVCRAGFVPTGPSPHPAIVHLCGSGPLSPDNWFEVQLRNGAGGPNAVTVVSAPTQTERYRGPYELPPAGPEGRLVKVACEAASRTCTGFVRVSGSWRQIGDAFDVPARESHLEIKTTGGTPGGASTTIWFDDCRIYPSPVTHDIGVMLQRADGSTPATMGDDPVCFDGENEPVPGCDLRVQLLTPDGATLIDETTVGRSFGFAMLQPDKTPGTVYPVAAKIRVVAGSRPIGPDHIIESVGVEGLYPDDVYVLTIE